MNVSLPVPPKSVAWPPVALSTLAPDPAISTAPLPVAVSTSWPAPPIRVAWLPVSPSVLFPALAMSVSPVPHCQEQFRERLCPRSISLSCPKRIE
jgi:hypothetical protein